MRAATTRAEAASAVGEEGNAAAWNGGKGAGSGAADWELSRRLSPQPMGRWEGPLRVYTIWSLANCTMAETVRSQRVAAMAKEAVEAVAAGEAGRLRTGCARGGGEGKGA